MVTFFLSSLYAQLEIRNQTWCLRLLGLFVWVWGFRFYVRIVVVVGDFVCLFPFGFEPGSLYAAQTGLELSM